MKWVSKGPSMCFTSGQSEATRPIAVAMPLRCPRSAGTADARITQTIVDTGKTSPAFAGQSSWRRWAI